MKVFDSLVAGAGIWGCTVARRLAEAGRKVLVVEKRPVIGGNVRCDVDVESGIEIHTYGSHIFHTHIAEVWDFVNRFVSFNGYQHKVLACSRMSCNGRLDFAKGRIYHLPLGLTLINKFFGVELKPHEVQPFLDGTFSPPGKHLEVLATNRRQAIFNAFIRGYTSKQWGVSPEEIDPAIIKRLPVRDNYDTNYFNDYHQGIPTTGYNSLFQRLLDHPNISVETEMSIRLAGTAFQVVRNLDSKQPPLEIDCGDKSVYYSGPIDSLFDYKYGFLPWRTLRFEQVAINMQDYQGTAVINYPDIDVPYTRIHEFKHYHPELEEVNESLEGRTNLVSRWGFVAPKTIIMREYPAQWKPGDEPYYPISNAASTALLVRYQDEVSRLNRTFRNANMQTLLTLGGRLGQYKYFDMDKSIESALNVDLNT